MQKFYQIFCFQNIFVQISICHALYPKVFSQPFSDDLCKYLTKHFVLKIFLCKYQFTMHSPKVFSQLFPVALRIYTTRYFCVQISFREYQLIMHSTPRPSLNFPRFFLRIFSKICWCKYCFANTDLSCTQPQGLLSTFPDAFCEYFTKKLLSQILFCKY